MARMTTAKFRFRKHQKIGAADAEHDQQFLRDCFVDSGDLQVLMDCARPERIVLGRTGAGKTALLGRLAQEQEEHTVQISPEQLSLTYLSNSMLLRYLADIGVPPQLYSSASLGLKVGPVFAKDDIVRLR